MSTRPFVSGLPLAALGNALVLLLLLVVAVLLAGLQSEPWWPARPSHDRWTAAGAALLIYAGACAWLIIRHRRRLARTTGPANTADAIRVVYASQTGFAHLLATRTADSLRAADVPAHPLPIDALKADDLAQGRILFVISTTGEGDPPDHALGFVRNVMSQPLDLRGLRYAVLALGDREYLHFCAFGHRLDDWLRQHGAQPLFDCVDVDNADESALRHWLHHLGQLGGIAADLPDWDTPHYHPWTLIERHALNPGSLGQPAFHLVLRPADGPLPLWQAGDIAEIGPCNAPAAVDAFIQTMDWDPHTQVIWQDAPHPLRHVLARVHLPAPEPHRDHSAQQMLAQLTPLPHREYSIASIPQDGVLELLVRHMLRPDGRPGLGSGWLCQYAPLGEPLSLRIRQNSNFHPPIGDIPLILIGNGTGIAGLRAHLKTRIAASLHRNWLIFGERQAAHDFFYQQELQHWQAQGALARLDVVFSRDQGQHRYVQHLLRDAGEDLRHWVQAGAAIYVCGSLEGMAPGVDAALHDVLGADTLEELRLTGRYRRDVY